MAPMYRYQLPVDQTGWTLSGETQTSFTWEYEDERASLLSLYDKGKKQQWDAATRIDWSQDLDPENPQYLGMQILIEGLALAASQRIRDFARNRLAASVNAYVMQDEARHVAFGRLALRDFYPQLSDAERAEREEFVVQACYHMRDRFNQKELWENLGLPVKEAIEVAMASENMRLFRKRLFSRIVPTVKDIGLWGPSVQKAFADMGAIEFADVDSDALLDQDNRVAEDFDAGVFVRKSLA